MPEYHCDVHYACLCVASPEYGGTISMQEEKLSRRVLKVWIYLKLLMGKKECNVWCTVKC